MYRSHPVLTVDRVFHGDRAPRIRAHPGDLDAHAPRGVGHDL
jgi:hypothetical protein